MDRFLEEFDGHVVSTRNGTELSGFCNRLVATFIEYGAARAAVRVADTGYSAEELYRGLWNACCKRQFSSVRVHKQEGTLLLIRKDMKA